ncbi:MAG: glycosyltransferase family 4 protein [Armatimonadetes bacterium]|nr:glycosyltransferase family 4 protein [Armatimonadota bacterium]
MKHKRVLMIGNYPPDRQFSMQGYRQSLMNGLNNRGWNVEVAKAQVRFNRWPHSKVSKWLGYMDKMVLFPKDLARRAPEYDLIHLIDQGNGFLGGIISQHNHIATIHDLLAIRASLGEMEGWTVGPSGMRFQQMILSGLRQMKHFISISDQTGRDLVRLVPGIQTHRKILNGLLTPQVRLPRDEADAILATKGIKPGTKFVVHLGTGRYKNHVGVVKLYDALRQTDGLQDLHLVMVTKELLPDTAEIIGTRSLEQTVHVLANISDDEVSALYSAAEMLLFPSLIEGFGLPIIEAQANGCPVVTSDREPMSEVALDSAVLVDPTNIESGVPRVLERMAHRQQWIDAGTENIKRFTFDRWVSDYEEAYTSMLS